MIIHSPGKYAHDNPLKRTPLQWIAIGFETAPLFGLIHPISLVKNAFYPVNAEGVDFVDKGVPFVNRAKAFTFQTRQNRGNPG
jgi:hypothetical protein